MIDIPLSIVYFHQITERKNMAKTMTKYQLDHFKQKVKRHFDPLIEEQELLVKQYRTCLLYTSPSPRD